MSGNPHRNWRVGHRGRDMIYYEENIAGTWQRLDIDGEMLLGRAHHVIYFASAERWQSNPEWARHRRDEIISRIKMEFREPDYEYHEEAAGAVPSAALPGRAANIPRPLAGRVTFQQRAALLTVIAILLGITAGMGWLVGRGLQSGETFLPSKRASLRRVISRQQEPVPFHAALTIYTLIGLGSGVAALWAIRGAWRIRRVRSAPRA